MENDFVREAKSIFLYMYLLYNHLLAIEICNDVTIEGKSKPGKHSAECTKVLVGYEITRALWGEPHNLLIQDRGLDSSLVVCFWPVKIDTIDPVSCLCYICLRGHKGARHNILPKSEPAPNVINAYPLVHAPEAMWERDRYVCNDTVHVIQSAYS